MIPRQAASILQQLALGYPILVITGPRQAGKTTLAQTTFPDKRYVSREDPDEHAFAEEDPRGFLGRFPDGAILDEAQHCPALFSYLQTRVDAEKRMVQLLPCSLQELQQGHVPINDHSFSARGVV